MIDDDIQLGDLMHAATADLHASPSVTVQVITGQRRRQRRARIARVGVTGVAAGTALGFVANAAGSGPASSPALTTPSAAPAISLTAAQRTLHGLAAVAATAPVPSGRYAVLTETTPDYARTSVIDGRTGDVWTYQKGAGVPSELPVARHDSLTDAQFAAIPTDPAGLRAYLLAQARSDEEKAQAAMQKMADSLPASVRAKKVLPSPKPLVGPEGDDDKVFGQATDLLWNPLVGPELRGALFDLLATTPGVQVNSAAKDDLGRSAVEVSRTDSVTKGLVATFQDPATGRTLESEWLQPGSEKEADVYQPITRTDTLPANPYVG